MLPVAIGCRHSHHPRGQDEQTRHRGDRIGPDSHSCHGAWKPGSGAYSLEGRAYCRVTGVAEKEQVLTLTPSTLRPTRCKCFPLAVGLELHPALLPAQPGGFFCCFVPAPGPCSLPHTQHLSLSWAFLTYNLAVSGPGLKPSCISPGPSG